MLQRAYSAFEVKEFDDESDVFSVSGIASTPTPDRSRDIVEPMGAKFATPMPLLWQHRHAEPVGAVTFAKPTKSGIPFDAEIPRVKESGRLKDRIDEAIHSIKYGLVAAVSIGFRAMEDGFEFLEDGGIKFNEWEWLELSLVTIPANPEARIQLAKSLDQQYLAALGRKSADRCNTLPGVSGKQHRRPIQLIPRRRGK